MVNFIMDTILSFRKPDEGYKHALRMVWLKNRKGCARCEHNLFVLLYDFNLFILELFLQEFLQPYHKL